MITWDPSYSVNYDGIDDQHRILISIIQEVETAINPQAYSFKNLIEIINKLEDYIREHFSYEEALMDKYHYPDVKNHMIEHSELRYRIQSTSYDNIGTSKEFYTETYQYLYHWLINHIMKTDKKLGSYLAEAGV